ncbi:hypothetical protein [Rhizomonospora bruguierae]|uniref:hypothetical protein n=1 Tax=Rhizomonospora bruguierae TaxID=1581705 RepID=UPI001BCE0023|nr:hypothetical protein [Micromonospora sp. NBRC 107566]
MFDNGVFDAAGSVVEELSAQEIDTTAAQAAGGLWTVPTTSTIGWICTLSWECSFPRRRCDGGD